MARRRKDSLYSVFADAPWMMRGIGCKLAEKEARSRESRMISISASLYAIPFYQK